ncbi:PAS domain S-box protein [Pseudosulfitobacter koreensis]|uniref:histidine kinase n=1 Tax=Pseudosulfitobacter koreensis TaxID=2968472 RepID=A0ABT1Z1F7_9RHOB|nr:PAS domain S-box protein [Pseudosulfitobacter koreense]MCR8826983.1 PAS domain S-box protein [Pseudosulfitobacter koreense]
MSPINSPSAMQTVAATVVLMIAAIVGNYTDLQISFSVAFIFGSVATLLALRFLGLVPALAVAFAGGAFTWLNWGHPYVLAVMLCEVIFVSLATRRLRNMALSDAAFWVLVGGPLVLLVYRFVLDLPFDTAFMIALKQSANGVMNATIATFIVVGITLSPLSHWFRPTRVSYTGIVFAVLMFLVTVIGVALIVPGSRNLYASEEAKISESLQLMLALTREELEEASEGAATPEATQIALRAASVRVNALVELQGDVVFGLLDAGGNLIASTGALYSIGDVPPDPRAQMQTWEPQGDMAVMKRTQDSRYVTFLPVTLAGTAAGAQHIIAAEYPVAPLIARLTHYSKTAMMVLAAIMLLSTVLAQLLSQLTTRSLRNLAQLGNSVTQAVASGDPRPPQFPKSNIIEYDMLSNALQEMSTHIVKDFAALSHLKDTLEDRVRVRAGELTRLSQVASQTTNGIMITDIDGQIDWVNDGFTRISGYAPEEVKGKIPGDLFFGAKSSPVTVAQIRKAFNNREKFEAEFLTYTRAGDEIWVSVTCSPLNDNGAFTGFMAIVSDITDRKTSSDVLERTLERLGLALETGHIGVWEWNIKSDETTWDDTVYDIYGVPRGTEINAARWKSCLHPDDVPRNDQLFEAARDPAKGILADEYRVNHSTRGERIVKSVSKIIYDKEGAPARITGVNFDVTEDRRKEQEVRELAQHAETVLNHIVDGIITVDMKGRIRSFNAAAQNMFGHSEAEVMGKHFGVLFHEDQKDVLKQLYLEFSHQTEAQRREAHEIQGRRKSGVDFPLEFAFAEVQRNNERLFVAIARDITERKRVERMTKEFISTINHELRTPLTSIQGSLKLIESGLIGPLPEKVEKMVAVSLRNSDRLRTLIDDLLDIDRTISGNMRFNITRNALKPLLEQVISDNQGFAETHRIALTLTPDVPEVDVDIDRDRFIQIMSNFISNAIKFSDADGKVLVDVKGTETDVTIHIIDEGCGIPPALHEQIFEKFFRVDSSDSSSIGGTGLGLSIAKAMAEQMNATVGLHSAVGEGSDFWIRIPL